jgi:NitT/TauT family transport system ATP-binding protein
LDAITRARLSQDLLRFIEARRMSVLLVTHDLEEALALSDVVYLLSRGPSARIAGQYPVPIARPRDVIKARANPEFGPLLERVWQNLSSEIGGAAQSEAAWGEYSIGL